MNLTIPTIDHWLIDLPEGCQQLTQWRGTILLLAHGAGAPMDSEFMAQMVHYLTQLDIAVIRFEFPYMQQRRQTGTKRPPNPQAILMDDWQQQIALLDTYCRAHSAAALATRLWIGGKSLGGRMASMVADTCSVAGVICLGYPFHPAGKPEKQRIAHLQTLTTTCVIIQGTRDKLGSTQDVSEYELSPMVAVYWLEDGDHDLKPRKRSGYSHAEHMQLAAQIAADAMNSPAVERSA